MEVVPGGGLTDRGKRRPWAAMALSMLPVAAEQRERETREREKTKRGTGVAVLIFGGELLRAPAAVVGDGLQGAWRGCARGRRRCTKMEGLRFLPIRTSSEAAGAKT